jgi:hypothetical protein
MSPSTIIDTIRRSNRAVMVRDLVLDLQHQRRMEGENWARRTDPTNLGAFHQGRQILIRCMGPAKFRPHVAEREVLDLLCRMAKDGLIRMESHGQPFNPERHAIPMNAIVTIHEKG